MPKALIVGCSGQDGTYLSKLLAEKGYEVIGIGRTPPFAGIDISDPSAVMGLVGRLTPDEIYYLASFYPSPEDAKISDLEWVRKSLEVHTLALNNFLYAIPQVSSNSRLFYAASCFVFGNPSAAPQDETTPMDPSCPYGISKAAGVQLCRYYRETRNVYGSVGILYNHESPLRRAQFVTKKVAKAAADIKRGLQDKVVLGNLDVAVDWGYAPDYVAAMWSILQLEEAGDFIIASGGVHTVRELVETAFQVVGLPWQDYIREDPGLLKRQRPQGILQGNARKLQRLTGWRPQMPFANMIREMVLAEMRNSGERS